MKKIEIKGKINNDVLEGDIEINLYCQNEDFPSVKEGALKMLNGPGIKTFSMNSEENILKINIEL